VTPTAARRLLSIGAEPLPEAGVHFRVWAPKPRRVELVLEGPSPAVRPLRAEADGYWSASVLEAAPGSLYRFRLDGEGPFPDPASRFQPDGPLGPSQVIDPGAFRWSDDGWRGIRLRGQVLYELHVGTFSPEGTWAGAARRLPEVREIGATCVELLPVADFPGRFGWGYDGVDLFAPSRLYGSPDDFRAFVDAAHALGVGVVLDVVYNHFGPDGCFVDRFSAGYRGGGRATEWGDAVNYDGKGSGPVRAFAAENAAYWVSEFHLDGLRLDATHAIVDDSPEHVVALIARSARAAAAGRDVLVLAENEPQRASMLRPPSQGGLGLDALWNDDFHHSAAAALTGRREAYVLDYRGEPQELISLAKRGFLYQGQRYGWQDRRRGEPALDVPAAAFVASLENHDQLANLPMGRPRLASRPGDWRAMTALFLLAPATPMLFQGQEWGSSTPFRYFADHRGELGDKVRAGRRAQLAQFATAAESLDRVFPDPGDPATFEACRLDWSERARSGPWLALHRDLLRLRREDPVFAAQRADLLDGAVLGPRALVLRFFGSGGDDRLLLLNLGADLELEPVPEPLLAPPAGRAWRALWCSEDPAYGGFGWRPPEDAAGRWRLSGGCAAVLSAGAP